MNSWQISIRKEKRENEKKIIDTLRSGGRSVSISCNVIWFNEKF